MDKTAAEAAASLKQILNSFMTVAGRSSANIRVRSVVGDRYVSIVRDDYMDTTALIPTLTSTPSSGMQPKRSA